MYAGRGATEILIPRLRILRRFRWCSPVSKQLRSSRAWDACVTTPAGSDRETCMVACGHEIGFAAVSLWLERCDLTQKKPLLNVDNPFENLRLRRTEESRSGRC